MIINNFIKNKTGFASLLTVLIIGAATLVMAVSASLLSMGELDMSTAAVKGSQALTNAEACVEESLRRIRIDTNYFATAKLMDVGSGQCVFSISGSGGTRRIVSEGSVSIYRKKVEVDLSLNDREISIDNWEEKVD